MRISLTIIATAAIALPGAPGVACAQAFPARPITLAVPFPPGGRSS